MAFLGRVLTVPDVFGKEEEINIKLSTICKNLLPGLALLLATRAFAANNVNKGRFRRWFPERRRLLELHVSDGFFT
jgi:hypothetical protein